MWFLSLGQLMSYWSEVALLLLFHVVSYGVALAMSLCDLNPQPLEQCGGTDNPGPQKGSAVCLTQLQLREGGGGTLWIYFNHLSVDQCWMSLLFSCRGGCSLQYGDFGMLLVGSERLCTLNNVYNGCCIWLRKPHMILPNSILIAFLLKLKTIENVGLLGCTL